MSLCSLLYLSCVVQGRGLLLPLLGDVGPALDEIEGNTLKYEWYIGYLCTNQTEPCLTAVIYWNWCLKVAHPTYVLVLVPLTGALGDGLLGTLRMATMSGVAPSRSWASMSASFSTSSLTTSKWPLYVGTGSSARVALCTFLTF